MAKYQRQKHGNAYYADKYAYFKTNKRGKYAKARILRNGKLKIVEIITKSKLPVRAKRALRLKS